MYCFKSLLDTDITACSQTKNSDLYTNTYTRVSPTKFGEIAEELEEMKEVKARNIEFRLLQNVRLQKQQASSNLKIAEMANKKKAKMEQVISNQIVLPVSLMKIKAFGNENLTIDSVFPVPNSFRNFP